MLFTWRRRWHPTAVLLPGKSHGWRSLVGCSPWGLEESDKTQRLPFTFLHWRRKWQPTPVFLPGESQGRRSLVDCRLRGRTESDMTEATQQQQQQQQHALYSSSGCLEWFQQSLSFFLLKFLIGYSFLSAIDPQLFLGKLVSLAYFEVKFVCCIFQSLRTSHILNIWCMWLFLSSLICVWFTCKVSCLEYKQQREPFSCVIVYLCFRNTLRCN